jgi:hypothetical protein
VEEAAVLEELLAVVGGEHDDRVLEVSAPFEFLEEAAQFVVDLSDLGVVEVREVLRVGGPESSRPERAPSVVRSRRSRSFVQPHEHLAVRSSGA